MTDIISTMSFEQAEVLFGQFETLMDTSSRAKDGAYTAIKSLLEDQTGRNYIGFRATAFFYEGVDGQPSSKNPALMRLNTAVNTDSLVTLGQVKTKDGKAYVVKAKKGVKTSTTAPTNTKAMKVSEADAGTLTVNLADRVAKNKLSMAEVEAMLAKIASQAGYRLKPGSVVKA